MADDGAAYTPQQLAEFAVLLGLLTDRLHDLAQDFIALQYAMIRAHVALAALPTGEPSAGEDQIWGDRLPT